MDGHIIMCTKKAQPQGRLFKITCKPTSTYPICHAEKKEPALSLRWATTIAGRLLQSNRLRSSNQSADFILLPFSCLVTLNSEATV